MRHRIAFTTAMSLFGAWSRILELLPDDSFTSSETHYLGLRGCDRDPARAWGLLYVDKIFPGRERSVRERGGTFQIRLAWRRGRPRHSVLSLDGLAAYFSRLDARTGRLQILWRCLGRRP